MASTRRNGQQTSLRPLFSKPAGLSSPPSDEPRRVTLPAKLAAQKRSKAYGDRVEKPHAKSRNRHGRSSTDLSEQFESGIEATREELRAAVKRALEDVEEEIDEQFAQVVSDFEEKLQLAIKFETAAFEPIAHERLSITNGLPNQNQSETREVVFGERMLEFRRIVDEEEKALEQLWQQWTDVQVETICLAIKVLGPDAVVVQKEDLSADLQGMVDAASKSHVQQEGVLTKSLDELARIEQFVKRTTDRTLKTLSEQQKALVAANKKAMQTVTDAMRGLGGAL